MQANTLGSALSLELGSPTFIPALPACSCEKAELDREFLLRGLERVLSSLPRARAESPSIYICLFEHPL